MHTVIQQLKDDGIIRPTDQDRQRNQYFKVENVEELEQRYNRALRAGAPRHSVVRSQAMGEGPKRVLYLEDRVTDLEAKLEQLSRSFAKVDELSDKVNYLTSQVDELVRLWS